MCCARMREYIRTLFHATKFVSLAGCKSIPSFVQVKKFQNMKLFAFILLVTLVVGDGFYQPFSPVLKSPYWQTSHLLDKPVGGYYYHSNRPNNWGQYYFQDDYYTPSVSYYDYHQNQEVFEGQQRSVHKNNEEANLIIEPKVSFSRQRFPSWNHKYFLLDDVGHSVQALRPFNPIEMLNMLNKPSTSVVTRPIFARQTVRMTDTETIKITSTKICVSSNLFTNPINPTVCSTHNRARRFIDSDDDDFLENISPTSVGQEDLVIPTILISDQRSASAVYEIESTKNNEDVDGKLEFGNLPGLTRNDRAMFNRNPSTTTVTVIIHETHFVTKAVNPVSASQPGVLLCLPPGMVVCA